MNKNKNELQLQIGENVRQCRDSKGLTQEELAEICNFSAAYCSQIETGQRMMSIETLVQVAEGLQTSADILIYGNTKDGRILHIVKMLESMPNDDLEFIENNIMLSTTVTFTASREALSIRIWQKISYRKHF